MLLGCEHRHRNEVYEFPERSHGWAFIVWGVPGYPHSAIDHGTLIVTFPADGVVITSTKLDFRATTNGSYFLDAAEHRLTSRPNIEFVGNGFEYDAESGRNMDYTRVFVGTKAEFLADRNTTAQVDKLWNSGFSSRLGPNN